MSLSVSSKLEARFARGFKTWAENSAITFRRNLHLHDVDPLDHVELARHIGIRLWTPRDVPTLPQASLDHLLSTAGDEWSAVSVTVGKTGIIVYNPSHSSARQASDIMHELAHIIRGHKPSQVIPSIVQPGIFLRTFDPLQEAEANWLAGCLLLPRVALAHCETKQVPQQEVCRHYGVSAELYKYRLNVTGVKRQFASRRRHSS